MFAAKNPNFRKVVEEKVKNNFFMHYIHFELTKIEAGYVEGALIIEPIHLQQNLFAHGGVISTLCDITAGFAAFSLVEKNKSVVTAEIKISYLNPGIGKKLFSKGWVIKPGSKFHFCESEVWALDGKKKIFVAKSSATMAVVEKLDTKE